MSTLATPIYFVVRSVRTCLTVSSNAICVGLDSILSSTRSIRLARLFNNIQKILRTPAQNNIHVAGTNMVAGTSDRWCWRSPCLQGVLQALYFSGFLVHTDTQCLIYLSSSPDLVSQARSRPGTAGASSSWGGGVNSTLLSLCE